MRPTDGPDAGKTLRLEPWQRGLLDAIDRERKPIVAIRAASQVGKTALSLGVGLRAAVDGAGTLLASATGESIKDLRRRLDRSLELSPAIGSEFTVPTGRRGPRSWNDRKTRAGGWVQLAAAGSPSQLASRTARVAIADEVARWPGRVRSGEGHPLALLRMRLADWGDDGRLLVISSPTLSNDAINLLWRDGDRRRLEYPCLACGERFPFAWEHVSGRERGEVPSIACSACGASHSEADRRRMLRSAAKWTAQRDEPDDEDVISFSLSRLDSARATLGQVVREWRRARRGAERGDPAAIMAFRNTVLGEPAQHGAADVDRLFERRLRDFDPSAVEQVTAGVDVQSDRLIHVALGFDAGSAQVWILDYGVTLGDPTEDDVWLALTSSLMGRSFAGLPVSVVSVDAGFSTGDVRKQCSRRRWWVPVVSRAGDGKPIARAFNAAAGVTTAGKDDTCAWWSGRIAADRVHLPREITRSEIAEMCAAEALTIDRGKLRWTSIESRAANHLSARGKSRGFGLAPARPNPVDCTAWRWARDRWRAKRRRCARQTGWKRRTFRRATVIPSSSA